MNGWSSRLWGASVLPLVLILLTLLMRWLPRIDPRGANYPKFAGTFNGLFISIMLFILGMHFVILASALGYPVAMGRWVPIGMGAFFIVMGNLLPRARPNWFVGIRTPWTLSSDRVWEKTHRLAGYVFVVLGVLIGLIGVVSGGSDLVMPWLGGLIGIAALSLVVYSYVEWRREGSVPRPSSPA
jgi:uncharacterized membrane protein